MGSGRTLRLVLLCLILVATSLRARNLFAAGLAADEALFATWARLIHAGRDPLLSAQAVDKPPLLFYLQAGAYGLLGPADWVARLPGFVASVLLVPLTARLAHSLYSDRFTGPVAAVILALSPLALGYSASAYIEPLLAAVVLAALLAAGLNCRDRPGTAGLLFGVAMLAKFQALLFLPLLIGLGRLAGWRGRAWGRLAAGALPGLALLAGWQLARSGRLDLLATQLAAYGGLRPAWSWELWSRLVEWAGLWAGLLDAPILWFGLFLGLPPFLAALIDEHDRPTAADQMLALYLFGYFAFHWLLAIPAWERYLLPAAPLAAVLLARYVWRVAQFALSLAPARFREAASRPRLALAGGLIFALFLAAPAEHLRGPASAPAAWAGPAAELRMAPYGTVLYTHDHSWEWRHALFDSRVQVSWYPNPAALAENWRVHGRQGQRYLAAPAGDEAGPVLRALEAAGADLIPVGPTGSGPQASAGRLYRLEP